MTLDVKDGEFIIDDEKSLWKGRSLYALYEQAHTPWEWHEPIMKRAKELEMLCFSTPFDASSIDFLETLDVPAYKIASFENADIPLLSKVADTGKPMIISTEMATLAELDETVRAVRESGCKKLIMLQCTSTYPATPENSNLKTLQHMKELFGCEVGLSDHTMGIGCAVAAVALGATVIEKHFTLNRADGGIDSVFSMEPEEMKQLVAETERAWQSLGSIKYGPTEAEKPSMKFRRSLYIVQDMKDGDILTPENLRCIRPGMGLPPKYYEMLLGRKVICNVSKGTATSWELLYE